MMRVALVVLVAMAGAAPTTAGATALTRGQAVGVAKRAASRQAIRIRLSLPPSAWTAACYRAGHGRWRCEAGAGQGYCSAGMWVGGTPVQPNVWGLRVSCLE
jgi:hypothetical protein